MKIIKFRAWDRENKRWMTPEIEDNEESELRIDIWGSLHFRKPWFEQESGTATIVAGESMFDLSQYTGLRDKDGAEIYIGDIVVGRLYNHGVVGWEYETKVVISDFSDIYELDNNSEEIEVIGNVYEDTELLEEI